jgi:hypothetical protein
MSWIIGRGDGYAFALLRDAAGPFATPSAALDHLLVHLEADRRVLNAAIAKAKRMRRRDPNPGAAFPAVAEHR